MVVNVIAIDDVQFLSLLKCGGQASVYRARLLGGDATEPVAIKIYNQRDDGYACYLRELAVLSRSRHPATPRLIAHFDRDGQFGLVLELLQGATLGEIFRSNHAITCQGIRFIACSLLRVLHYLHTGLDDQMDDVVHGDLSPDNVFLGHQGNIFLIDFGAATIGGRRHSSKVGAFGKRKYLAPEQLDGGLATIWSDLFSLGAILFEALTLKAFSGINYRREFDELRKCVGLHDHDWFMAIKCSLAPSPGFRPRNARQLLKSLTINRQGDDELVRIQLAKLITAVKSGS